MEQDIRDELAAVQLDWETAIAEKRKRRQDVVMKALDAGCTKYAIAQAMGVRGPTVDSIIKTARREPAVPVTVQAAPELVPEPEQAPRARKNCAHPGVVKGICHAPGCGQWVGKKN